MPDKGNILYGLDPHHTHYLSSSYIPEHDPSSISCRSSCLDIYGLSNSLKNDTFVPGRSIIDYLINFIKLFRCILANHILTLLLQIFAATSRGNAYMRSYAE